MSLNVNIGSRDLAYIVVALWVLVVGVSVGVKYVGGSVTELWSVFGGTVGVIIVWVNRWKAG